VSCDSECRSYNRLFDVISSDKNRLLIPTDVEGVNCLHCGYDLRGLSEPVCPECGNRFKLFEVADGMCLPTQRDKHYLKINLRLCWLYVFLMIAGGPYVSCILFESNILIAYGLAVVYLFPQTVFVAVSSILLSSRKPKLRKYGIVLSRIIVWFVVAQVVAMIVVGLVKIIG